MLVTGLFLLRILACLVAFSLADNVEIQDSHIDYHDETASIVPSGREARLNQFRRFATPM